MEVYVDHNRECEKGPANVPVSGFYLESHHLPSRPLDIIFSHAISRIAVRTYQTPKAECYVMAVCTFTRMREMQGMRSVSRNRVMPVAKRFGLAVCTSCIVYGILCTLCIILCLCSTNHTTEARSLSTQDQDSMLEAMYYTPCQSMCAMTYSIKIRLSRRREAFCQIPTHSNRATDTIQYTQDNHGD
jgi:hypothetical protein